LPSDTDRFRESRGRGVHLKGWRGRRAGPNILTAVAADTCRGQSAKRGAPPTAAMVVFKRGARWSGLVALPYPSTPVVFGSAVMVRRGQPGGKTRGIEAATGPRASQLPLPRLGSRVFYAPPTPHKCKSLNLFRLQFVKRNVHPNLPTRTDSVI